MNFLARTLAAIVGISTGAWTAPALADSPVSISKWLSCASSIPYRDGGQGTSSDAHFYAGESRDTALCIAPFGSDEQNPEKISGLETALLSLLLPGTGHFNFRTRNSLIGGLVHIGLEVFSIAGFVCMYQDSKKAYAAEDFDHHSLRIDWSGVYVVGALIVMAAHRIECLIEGLTWYNYENRKHEREGLLSRTNVSILFCPRDRIVGTCISMTF